MQDPDATTDRPRKRTWLRRVCVIVLSLIVGAIINVLVAWGFSLWGEAHLLSSRVDVCYWDSYGGNGLRTEIRDTPGTTSVWTGSPVPYNGWESPLRHAPYWCWPRRSLRIPNANPRVAIIEVAYGWPLRSLMTYMSGMSARMHFGIEVGAGRALPLRPILFGFVVNTLLYSVAPLLILLSVAKSRRHRRHSRNLCLSCAYDLRGAKHDVCPECGK